jgi:hypothetical protein
MKGKAIALVRKRPVTWTLVVLGSVAILVGSRWLLDPGDWAGLGQWVGGLGAFVAAGAALRIASAEVRRERARDAERLRVHAYYVSGRWAPVKAFDHIDYKLEVRNGGTEPVLNVELVAVHVAGQTGPMRVKVTADKGTCRVLLPGESWRPRDWRSVSEDLRTTMLSDFVTGPDGEVEITFEDLGGTRWRRIGTQPPVPDGKAASTNS